ncbi:MAG TPA: nitrogen regulation protein NR(II) [Gammaproteobacteria bacterium]|nr:nitrogen regulation protein NR(II) [Gammaproteobacteria bacterium]
MISRVQIQQRILDGLSVATLLFNTRFRLIFINPAGEWLLGISARHLLGQHFSELMQFESPIMPALEEALHSHHPFTRHEMTLSLAHGDERVVDFTVIPLIEADEEPELLLELTPINNLLRIAREEHRQTQQVATREMLRGLAHEIKNPLGGLRGAAQLLEKQLATEELKEYTQVIIREADRLKNLLNRMLGPNTQAAKTATNIHEVLERVRHLVCVEVDERIKLERDYDPSIPEVDADRDQLVQALLNIIRNACQALPDRGTIILRTRVERKFTIGQNRHNLVARINVIDNGPGINDEMKEKIFFPMVTGRANGSGLGLSIAQSLIEQHGGAIECQSEPGQTTFSILLPIQSRE